MIDVVKTDVLLALLLSERSKITFHELRKLNDQMIAKKSNILLDISGPSIELAIYHYPKTFAFKESAVVRAEGADFKSSYIKNEFLSTISPRAASTVKNCFRYGK